MSATADDLITLGRHAFQQGNHPVAESHFRAAHAAGARGFELFSFLGFLARARDDLDAADEHYVAALDLAPTDAATHSNLAEIRRRQGRMAEAVALMRRAAGLAPEGAEIHANLGEMLLAMRRPAAAVPVLERALLLNPALTSARSDLVICLCSLNRYPEAIEHYRTAYRLEPRNASARYLEALALLAMGDFSNGWRKHEVRWYAELGADRRGLFDGPSWLGEPGIEGRTILLHAEQGLGDTIQFVRYAPLVAERGAHVRLLVPATLAPLLASLPGIADVVPFGDPIPAFDAHCSLMSLPRAFRTEIATIPTRIPYLRAPADRITDWTARLGPKDGRRRIALAWSGSTSAWNRSLPLAALAPLLSRPDCQFHVAQTEIAEQDRAAMRDWPGLVDHSGALRDFADTAALLSCMDLVISVDTSLAHLAGAVGCPVWTMLPLGADYRWMTDRTDSPWYPTMRLFRQPAFDDWAGVLTAVGAALDTTGPDGAASGSTATRGAAVMQTPPTPTTTRPAATDAVGDAPMRTAGIQAGP